MPGKVYLGGAGPGDPRLITLRLKEALETADAVLYDRIVNPSLLSLVKPGCRLVDVGKRPGEDGLTQSKINRRLVASAKKYGNVLRLKGGDPMIFARSSEEAEALKKHGIEYEIIPGVSSINGMAAYAEFPITHRACSSSFAVATGHPARGKKLEDLTTPRADTVLYLMGMENMAYLIERMLQNGFTKATPAAVIENATTALQRVVTGTLGDIVAKVKAGGLSSPAVFLIGEVVNCRRGLSWAEKRPLFGKRIVLTRPREQMAQTASALRDLGAEVLELPALEIIPLPKAALFSRTGFLTPYTRLVFTSQTGVDLFFNHLLESGSDARELYGKKVYAIGPQTARALIQRGIKPDSLPGVYSSEGLVAMLKNENLKNQRFLLPRAKEADPLLEDFLKSRGAKVAKLKLYRIAAPQPYFILKEAEAVVFTSSLTVKNFLAAQKIPQKAAVFCLGEKTKETALELGIKNPITAREATGEALVAAVAEFFKKELT